MTSNHYGTAGHAWVLGIAIAISACLALLFGRLISNLPVGVGGGVIVSLMVGLALQAQDSAKDGQP
jgi:hypothetical protein